jgi:hypothetical protein
MACHERFRPKPREEPRYIDIGWRQDDDGEDEQTLSLGPTIGLM